MKVGRKIWLYLKERRIKQRFVAEQLGIPPTTLSSILLGKQRVNVEIYARICDVLGVSLEKFVDYKHKSA
ncbi:MAG: helix-turn-helix transcriptional regulator [Clostridia bacterium]|nr:helix-turn-helix transcriptional regulator [Clostridia bacterium]